VELPSFWTDQYGIRIQYLGSTALADALVIDGEPKIETSLQCSPVRQARSPRCWLIVRGRCRRCAS
jgi:Reductase C-terminal